MMNETKPVETNTESERWRDQFKTISIMNWWISIINWWRDKFKKISIMNLLGYVVFLIPIFYFLVWKLLPLAGLAKIIVGGTIAGGILALTTYFMIYEERRLSQLRKLVGVFFIVLGAPIVAIYFAREDQIRLFKLFVVGYFSFLPAWIYLQFISIKGKTLYDEYVLNLYRLHIDRYATLPKPPPHTWFYLLWDRLHRELKGTVTGTGQDMYTKKFQALYGPISPEQNSAFSFRGETMSPVVIATVIISVSWVLIVEPQTIFGISLIPAAVQSAAGTAAVTTGGTGPQIPFETVRFAILGAYFYVLQMLVRRYFQNDLRTSAYINATTRFVVVIPLVWVIDLLLQEQVPLPNRLALAFIIGVFPNIGWEAIVALVKLPLKIVVPSLSQKYPLSDLDGLNIWYESRLLEEGIEDMQNLATADLVNLMLHTRIPVERLVDWIDQALLYLHLSDTRDKQDKDNGGGNRRQALRRLGIRTATDVDILFAPQFDEQGQPKKNSNESLIKGLEKALGQPGILKVIYQTLQNDANFFHVKEWKRYTDKHIQQNKQPIDDYVKHLRDDMGLERLNGVVTITFENKTNEELNVYWSDHRGEAEKCDILMPGEPYKRTTFEGDLWFIKLANNDRVIKTIEASSDSEQTHVIKESDLASDRLS